MLLLCMFPQHDCLNNRHNSVDGGILEDLNPTQRTIGNQGMLRGGERNNPPERRAHP